MTDRFDLQRFVQAQDPVLPQVRRELAAGRKQSHWMWFVFPQIAGLGHSPMAQRYAIASLEEARAYLAHRLLGPRLLDCTGLVNGVEGHSAHAIFGSPDNMKFHSSMTLFHRAGPREPAFAEALRRFFGGAEDPGTVARLPGG
jgi:uncharacterized protein (DUF1810 family)